MLKNGFQKGFGFLKKMKSLVLSEIGLNWKFLWSFNMQLKTFVWESSGSYVNAKNAPTQSELSIL